MLFVRTTKNFVHTYKCSFGGKFGKYFLLNFFMPKNQGVRVIEWIQSIDDQALFISAVTIGEIEAGILLRFKPKSAAALSA